MHLFLRRKKEVNLIISKIKTSLQGVCDDVFSRDPPHNIINHLTYRPGFDWYFPNFANNHNSDLGKFFYDEDIVKGLLGDSGYRNNFLRLTKQYFVCAGLMKDGQAINYGGIGGHMVRLDKIIESYRILLCYCDDVSIRDQEGIAKFKRELQNIYKQVYLKFYSDKINYGNPITSYHRQSIAMIFDSDLKTMAFPSEEIKEDMMSRALAVKTYFSDLKKSYLEIEKEVKIEINPRTRVGSGPLRYLPAAGSLSLTTDQLALPKDSPRPIHQRSGLSISSDLGACSPDVKKALFRPAAQALHRPPAQALHRPPARSEDSPGLSHLMARLGRITGPTLTLPPAPVQEFQMSAPRTQSLQANKSQNQDKYNLVKPSYKRELFHKRITDKDRSGYTRNLDFRYFPAFNSGEITSSEQAYQKIADNLNEAMTKARIDDKEFVKRAIKIAQKHGGLSNFFDDNGEKINDHNQILEIINKEGKDKGEKLLTVDELKTMMKLSFYFQKENEKYSILTGRLNGSNVGLRLAYVSDEVIKRFSLAKISSRSAQR